MKNYTVNWKTLLTLAWVFAAGIIGAILFLHPVLTAIMLKYIGFVFILFLPLMISVVLEKKSDQTTS